MSKQVGSSMRSLFRELGEEEELDLLTRKKVLADQLRARMAALGVTKDALAEAMQTSRTVVYRLLDPADTGLTLETLTKASRALGLELRISFASPSGKKESVVRMKAAPKATRKKRSARDVRAKLAKLRAKVAAARKRKKAAGRAA
jgi:antitoxin HicB